jgi:RND family efflux transporter MFP subunit
MGRILIKIAGLLLGMLLIITGLAKAADIGEFASGILQEVPMLPALGTACAFMIVTTEIGAGAGLYFRRFRRMSGAVAAMLFLVFTILIARKIVEGTDFQCECFGILELQLPLTYHLLLNIALTFVALLVAWRPTGGSSDSYSSRRLPLTFLVPVLMGASLLVWLILSAFRSPASSSDPEEKKVEMDVAFPVKISKAYRGTLVKGITSSGLLRPERTVELVPKVSGEVIAVHAYEGKEVVKGETVAVIDGTEFRLAYERASFALLAAQIEYRTLSASPFLQTVDTIQARRDLEAARDNYQRVRAAYAAGRIDGPVFIRAKRTYESARAYFSANREDVIANRSGLVQAREAYERAKRELEATQIRAPFTGRITGWEGAIGMQAHAGRALCSLVDLSRILIDADIVEREAARVCPGQGAVISCMAFPGRPYPGIVRAVSPVIDLKSRMMRAAVELSATRGGRRAPQVPLRPGMFATVLIETDRLHGRLLVPREALLTRDLRPLVFTLEHGRAKWHYVETGEENQEFVEVRSGLAEGDTVIVEGHQALAHDARVFVKD